MLSVQPYSISLPSVCQVPVQTRSRDKDISVIGQKGLRNSLDFSTRPTPTLDNVMPFFLTTAGVAALSQSLGVFKNFANSVGSSFQSALNTFTVSLGAVTGLIYFNQFTSNKNAPSLPESLI